MSHTQMASPPAIIVATATTAPSTETIVKSPSMTSSTASTSSSFVNDDYEYLINCTDLITTCQEALQENDHYHHHQHSPHHSPSFSQTPTSISPISSSSLSSSSSFSNNNNSNNNELLPSPLPPPSSSSSSSSPSSLSSSSSSSIANTKGQNFSLLNCDQLQQQQTNLNESSSSSCHINLNHHHHHQHQTRASSSAASSGLGLSLEEDLSSVKYCHSDEEFSSLNSITNSNQFEQYPHHHRLIIQSSNIINTANNKENLHNNIMKMMMMDSTATSLDAVVDETTAPATTTSFTAKALLTEFNEWLDYIENQLNSVCYCTKIEQQQQQQQPKDAKKSIPQDLQIKLELPCQIDQDPVDDVLDDDDDDDVEDVLDVISDEDSEAEELMMSMRYNNDDNNDAHHHHHNHHYVEKEQQKNYPTPPIISDKCAIENNPKSNMNDVEQQQLEYDDDENHEKIARNTGNSRIDSNSSNLLCLPETMADWSVILARHEAFQNEYEKITHQFFKKINQIIKPQQQQRQSGFGSGSSLVAKTLEPQQQQQQQPENEDEEQETGQLPETNDDKVNLTRQISASTTSLTSSSSSPSFICSIGQQKERCLNLWIRSLEYLTILQKYLGKRCPRHYLIGNLSKTFDDDEEECGDGSDANDDVGNDADDTIANLNIADQPNQQQQQQKNHLLNSCQNLPRQASQPETTPIRPSVIHHHHHHHFVSLSSTTSSAGRNSSSEQRKRRFLGGIFDADHHQNQHQHQHYRSYSNLLLNSGSISSTTTSSSSFSFSGQSNPTTTTTANKRVVELRSTGIGGSSVRIQNRRVQTRSTNCTESGTIAISATMLEQQQDGNSNSNPTATANNNNNNNMIRDTHLDGGGSPGADSGVFSSSGGRHHHNSRNKYEIIQKDIGYSSDADMSDAIEAQPHSSDQSSAQKSSKKRQVRRRRTRTSRNHRPWSFHADWTAWDYYQTPFFCNNISNEDLSQYDNENIIRKLTEFGENYESWFNNELELTDTDLRDLKPPPVVIEKPEIENEDQVLTSTPSSSQQQQQPVKTLAASTQIFIEKVDACISTSPIPFMDKECQVDDDQNQNAEEAPTSKSTTTTATQATETEIPREKPISPPPPYYQSDYDVMDDDIDIDEKTFIKENKFTQTKGKFLTDNSTNMTPPSTPVPTVSSTKNKIKIVHVPTTTTTLMMTTNNNNNTNHHHHTICRCGGRHANETNSSSYSSIKFYTSIALAGLLSFLIAVTQFNPEIHKTYPRPPPL